ncbi:unnamed protein product [Lactuca saligna]|uniref:Uncharacterized protein n=1 Tax=Lactuca saligna TaxID=75948 RepID=A0AA35YIK4_LACSI|nr:unnamed protein product [Lactuca saligna]
MLQGTTKLPWKFSHHPAAAGTFFTVMLLGLKFCTCQYEGSLQNVRLGIQLLEDGIYRAALGWFAYEPEWFEHDHGNFAHIEAQSVNSFVHYLQNDPKALGGEYGGSFLDMDHCHPVWGPMENYAACRDKRKQLLLMLCQHEADRLQVWAQPVNYKLKIRNRRLQVRFGIESLRFRVRSEASRCRKKKSGGGISRLQNPFVGAAFQSSLKPRNVNCLGYLGNKFPRKPRYDIIPRAKKNDWISHGIRFSQSFGENVEILWKNMGLRSGYQPGQVRAFGMIAGGSGITPMFQVVRAVLENPSDKTKVHLVYANVMGKVGPGGHPSAIETGTKFYISNLDYSISNDDIKVFEIDNMKAWKSVLIFATSYALGLFMIAKSPWYFFPLAWAWTETAVTGVKL